MKKKWVLIFIYSLLLFIFATFNSNSLFGISAFLSGSVSVAIGETATPSPGCQTEYTKAFAGCEAARNSADAAAQAVVATTTTCRPGYNDTTTFTRSGCAIEKAAQEQQSAAQTSKAANDAVAATCETEKKLCLTACQQADKVHAKRIASINAETNPSVKATLTAQLNEQKQFQAEAKAHFKYCETELGAVVAGTKIQAWQLGLAAAAAGGVMMLTQSKGSSGSKSSGSSATLQGSDASVDNTAAGASSDASSGEELGSLEDMKQYWTANNCEQILSIGTSEASVVASVSTGSNASTQSTYVDNGIVNRCGEIANNDEFSGTLLALGSCSETSHLNRPDCFDRLNSYCLHIQPQYRLKQPICSGFCYLKGQADACQFQEEFLSKPAIVDNTGSSQASSGQGTSGKSPFSSTQQTTSGSSTQSTGNSTMASTTTFKATSSAKTGCSLPQLVNTPACEAPMKKYCGRYGTKGKGCATFCSSHSGVCRK